MDHPPPVFPSTVALLLIHKHIKDYNDFEQDSLCTYNVTLGRVRATIVAVGKQYVLRIP